MAADPLIPMPAASPSTPYAETAPHVLCGIDFSETSGATAEVAAQFARRLGEPLTLVHAVNEPARDSLPHDLRQELAIYERKQLHDERERLNALGVRVIEDFRAGAPHEVLVEAARGPEARLLVLSSGRSTSLPGLLGSVAERVAESSPIPTLVVRNAAPLLDWLAGRRSLRVFVAADLTPFSEAAIRWAIWLRSLGRANLTIAHIEQEPMEPAPLYRSPPLQSAFEEMRRSETRSFRQFVKRILGDESARLRVSSGWGRSDAHLIHLAEVERADLVVTGTHQRHGFGRLMHHSFLRGLLHYAPMNVACIPASAQNPEERP